LHRLGWWLVLITHIFGVGLLSGRLGQSTLLLRGNFSLVEGFKFLFECLSVVVLFGFMDLVTSVRDLFFDEHIASCFPVNLKEFIPFDSDGFFSHCCIDLIGQR
jgi:hypothetical protein